MPNISASSSDISQWNKRSSFYFEVLFAFANANLHNDCVLVFAHAVDQFTIGHTLRNSMLLKIGLA